MKNTLKGYTLAEILVTLAIVGVVAALVLPHLLGNATSKANEGAVKRAVELMQNGITNIMQEAQNRSEDGSMPANLASIQLDDIQENGGNAYLTDDDNLFSETMALMGTEEVADYTINNIRNYSGNALEGGMLSNTHAYKFKKATPVIIFQNVSANGIANAEDDEVITRIFIDANGSTAPNEVGRDVYLFGLTNSGLMVPAGTDAYNNNIINDNIALYDAQAGGCISNITDGLSCAAKIMMEK